ncbi:hypothetical protein [Thermocatellispora tengchongensis]|uniref:hypothetical protein n=1 Tax=Thermocatellispora tengchongensis TaxID=1073253 RepID=UPI00362AFCF3
MSRACSRSRSGRSASTSSITLSHTSSKAASVRARSTKDWANRSASCGRARSSSSARTRGSPETRYARASAYGMPARAM